MSLPLASLSPEFAWLRSRTRPSSRTVDIYAHLIAHAEGYPAGSADSHLLEEAELQLWTWQNEKRKRGQKTQTPFAAKK